MTQIRLCPSTSLWWCMNDMVLCIDTFCCSIGLPKADLVSRSGRFICGKSFSCAHWIATDGRGGQEKFSCYCRLSKPGRQARGCLVLVKVVWCRWVRRLVAGFSPRRPRLTPGSVHFGFVVDKVTLGYVFIRVLWFSHQYHFTVALHSYILSGDEQSVR
jgi:hypothetical protein